jgi:hypothetical protein
MRKTPCRNCIISLKYCVLSCSSLGFYRLNINVSSSSWIMPPISPLSVTCICKTYQYLSLTFHPWWRVFHFKCIASTFNLNIYICRYVILANYSQNILPSIRPPFTTSNTFWVAFSCASFNFSVGWVAYNLTYRQGHSEEP